jgi:hypothetical protein
MVAVFVQVNEVQAQLTTTPPQDGRSHGYATRLGEEEEEEEEEEIVKA